LEKIKKKYHYLDDLLLRKQPVRFILVGGFVFLSNLTMLFIFHGLLNLNLLLSQAIAAEGAIIVSFLLHHHWTYKNRDYEEKNWKIRFLHFNGSSLGGTAIANGILIVCVHVFKINYLIGLSIGALVALLWNYFANLKFVWN